MAIVLLMVIFRFPLSGANRPRFAIVSNYHEVAPVGAVGGDGVEQGLTFRDANRLPTFPLIAATRFPSGDHSP